MVGLIKASSFDHTCIIYLLWANNQRGAKTDLKTKQIFAIVTRAVDRGASVNEEVEHAVGVETIFILDQLKTCRVKCIGELLS